MKNPILKVSIFAAALLLQTSTAYAASTWMPEYVPGQTVYVDPELKNHPIAPYSFSPLLSDKLNEESVEGIQYFVIAAQQGNETLPEKIPLGVAKVDQLLPTWTNRPGFPKENYVVIFWVRRSDDLNKGSVGVNTGKIPRQAGVTSSLLSSSNGLVIPALKENMPANPEGAMLDIVENIENKIEDYREAEITKKQETLAAEIAAKQHREKIEKFNQNIEIWAKRFLYSLPFAGAISIVGFAVVYRQSNKKYALFLVNEWNEICNNSTTFYLEIEKNELPKIQLLPLDEDSELEAEFLTLAKLLARFIASSTAGSSTLDEAKYYLKRNSFQKAINTLRNSKIKLKSVDLKVVESDLAMGFDFSEEIKASDFRANLKAQWESVKNTLNQLLMVQQFYLEMSEENAFSSFKERSRELLDCHINELNYYGLSEGSFKNSGWGMEVENLATEYEELVSRSELKFRASKICESDNLLDSAENKITELTKLIDKTLMNKRLCEKSYQRRFDNSDLEKHLALSNRALKECKADFPNENYDEFEKILNDVSLVKSNFLPLYKSQFTNFYSDKNFGRAYCLLEDIEQHKKDLIEKLKNIIEKPQKLRGIKNSLLDKYGKIKSKNQDLESGYQIEIDILPWETASLLTLTHMIYSLETLLQNARSEERESMSSNYSSSNSSSSYESYSSGSDYGSYSGGSDYENYSGGGDY